MATATNTLVELPDSELRELLHLLEGADSAELKLTMPEDQHRSTIQTLGLDPLDAQIRQVFFFDTRDLDLYEHGLVVRGRRVQGRGDDTVVKLRPVVPQDLPASVRDSENMVVEVDAMPGGYVCSASLKGTLGPKPVRRVAAGERRVSKLFSEEQRSFYSAHAPEGIGLDDLAVLGPIFVLKVKSRLEDAPVRKLVTELWLYPDGSRILELSTKCAPSSIFQVAVELRAFLSGRGLDLSGEQQTKTRTALEFFSASDPA